MDKKKKDSEMIFLTSLENIELLPYFEFNRIKRALLKNVYSKGGLNITDIYNLQFNDFQFSNFYLFSNFRVN